MSDGRLLGDLTKATGQGSLGWVCPPGCASSKGRFGPVVSFITREVDCSPRGVGLRADAPHSSGSEDPASVAVLTGGGMTGCGQGGGLASNHEEANPSGGKRSSESMRCGGGGTFRPAGQERRGLGAVHLWEVSRGSKSFAPKLSLALSAAANPSCSNSNEIFF